MSARRGERPVGAHPARAARCNRRPRGQARLENMSAGSLRVAIHLRSPLTFHAPPLQVVRGDPSRPVTRLHGPAQTHVAQHSGEAASVSLVRISTDNEINVNDQPEGISVVGKDIR